MQYIIYLCIFLSHFTEVSSLVSYKESMGSVSAQTNSAERAFFEKLYNNNNYEIIKPSIKSRIPKIIHQIWVGGPLPKQFEIYVNSIKKCHPDWEYRLWTDSDVEGFKMRNRKAFENAKNLGMKSDIWRYEILDRYGGVYLDTDFYWLRPLDILHHTCDFYSGVLTGGVEAANGIIGSKSNHPILKSCIKRINKTASQKVQSSQDVIDLTGPVMFTKTIIGTLSKDKTLLNGTVIYPPSFFFPFPNMNRKNYWNGKMSLESLLKRYSCQESFAMHMWATSWQKSSPSMKNTPKPRD